MSELNRRYDLQFKQVYPSIFEKLAYFAPAFGGTIETIDGVSNNESMFTIKTKVDSVVIAEKYDTDENKGMGTGSYSSGRFPNIHENKWQNKTVPYTGDYAWAEGIDRHTVNNDLAAAVAEVTEDISYLLNDKISTRFAKTLADNASEKITAADKSAENIIDAFDQAKTALTNNRVRRGTTRRVYVKDEIENILVNANIITTAKNSSVNMDSGEVRMVKGFVLEVVPAEFFPADVDMIFTVDGVGHSFLGIETARTLDNIADYDGILYQGALRYGDWIPEENKKGIITVQVTGGLSAKTRAKSK